MNRSVRTAVLPFLCISSGRIKAQAAIDPASVVRVTTPNVRMTGHIVRADSGRLRVVSKKGGQLDVAMSDVTRLEIYRGRHTKQFAVTLGVIGGLAGAVLGARFARALCETSKCDNDVPAGMALGALVFGPRCALTGAAIGFLIPRWAQLDPSQLW